MRSRCKVPWVLFLYVSATNYCCCCCCMCYWRSNVSLHWRPSHKKFTCCCRLQSHIDETCYSHIPLPYTWFIFCLWNICLTSVQFCVVICYGDSSFGAAKCYSLYTVVMVTSAFCIYAYFAFIFAVFYHVMWILNDALYLRFNQTSLIIPLLCNCEHLLCGV